MSDEVRDRTATDEAPTGQALPGGADRGARRQGDRVLRTGGTWTPAVQHLLSHLSERGFVGAPRPLGFGPQGEEVEFLAGETVGGRRPWPGWVHDDEALGQVADWLRRYHDAVSDYVPPVGARWREVHAEPGPRVVIAHNDAAPYNAVWRDDRLVGFVDWDMAGPRDRRDDLAWTAFSWVPLHARHVVAAEGFGAFARRRDRLAFFLRAYGSAAGPDAVLARLDGLLTAQVALIAARAAAGDPTYRRMLAQGTADDLDVARRELADV